MTVISLHSALQQAIDKRYQESALRSPGSSNPSLVDFSSNDYLGLARSESLAAAIRMKEDSLHLINRNGATGSRLLTGNNPYTESVEQRLASVFKAEACLLFNSGYTANMAVLSSLPQKDDTIICDELAHACIKDGARLSPAKRFKFRHNDITDLQRKMKQTAGRRFVVVESVYSMDGDNCPLEEISALCRDQDATLIIDEAHSTGICGPSGGGMAIAAGLEHLCPVRIYTFGKAMGIHGACIAGSKILIQYLVNFARPFIYTTALPPHSIAAVECAFEFLEQHIGLQELLQDKINVYNDCISPRIRATKNNSAIQTITIGGNEKTRHAALHLQQSGFDVRPILAPTVPAGTERLRICLHTFNSDQEILALASAVNEFMLNA